MLPLGGGPRGIFFFPHLPFLLGRGRGRVRVYSAMTGSHAAEALTLFLLPPFLAGQRKESQATDISS